MFCHNVLDIIIFRNYCYAAYCQFSWFIYAKLGCYVRCIIRSWVVHKIRETFPEAIGMYTNFVEDEEEADAISEVVAAWEYSDETN